MLGIAAGLWFLVLGGTLLSRTGSESAAAGLPELRGDISAHNRGKSKPTAAEVKSWIGEGRR
jgi:hypothetical protein